MTNMSARILHLILLFLISNIVCSQNIVPNGDFSISTCPDRTDQIEKATGWYSPTGATPDHFHNCGNYGAGIGQNDLGFQLPFTGSGYAGIYTLSVTSRPWIPDTTFERSREYIECELDFMLEKDVQYSFSMRVSLSEKYNTYISNKIGVDFTKYGNIRYGPRNYKPIYRQPEIEFNQIVTDSVAWVLLTDTFTASDSLRFLTIGGFAHSSELDIIQTKPWSNYITPYGAYYYIDDVRLEKIPDPIIIIGDKQVCSPYEDSITLNATTVYSEYRSYSWYDSITNQLLYRGENSSIKIKPEETTHYMLIADNDTVYSKVHVYHSPKLTLSDTTICLGTFANIAAEVSRNGKEAWSENYTLNWENHPNLTVTSDSTARVNPLSDTYFYANIYDSICSGNMDSTLVSVKPYPITSISPKEQLICKGKVANITASGGQTYHWSLGGKLDSTTTSQNKRSIFYSTSTFVAVQALDSPCKGGWDTSHITIDTIKVRAAFSVSPIEGFTNFKPRVINLSRGGEIYFWDFANGTSKTVSSTDDELQNRTYLPQYPMMGTYQITLKATRQSGCTDSTFHTILVHKKFVLEIPNAFTPNDDGLNEAFNIITSDGVTIEGSIYNRWGEQVYKWDTANGQFSWDGDYMNKPAQAGVYIYILKLRELDNTVHYSKGTVTLSR